jgi:hypothetical protein
MKRILAILGASLVLSAITACGGGNTVPGQTVCSDPSDPSTCTFFPEGPAPTPQPPEPFCTYPNGGAPQMIYPAPGATGVSRTLSQFVIADSYAAPYASTLYAITFSTESTAQLFATFGFPIRTLSPFVALPASQVPSPSASPAVSNPIFESVSANPTLTYVTLTPQTTYYAYIFSYALYCNANGPIGSFTTGST